MFLILLGDITQLQPIADKHLYYTQPVRDIILQGFYVYQTFRTVFTLKLKQCANSLTKIIENSLLIFAMVNV